MKEVPVINLRPRIENTIRFRKMGDEVRAVYHQHTYEPRLDVYKGKPILVLERKLIDESVFERHVFFLKVEYIRFEKKK